MPEIDERKKPLFRMRVHPEGRSLYFIVNVWPTKKAMHQHVTWMKPPFEAICSGRTRISFRDGSQRVLPEIGEVNFNSKRIGSAIVAHEFTHAAFIWARRIGLDPENLFGDDRGASVHADEERFCHALDRMVGTFIDRGYKVGLW